MSDKKRPPAPVPDPNAAPAPAKEDAEPDFYTDGEHDGWGPIKRRTPTPPPSEEP